MLCKERTWMKHMARIVFVVFIFVYVIGMPASKVAFADNPRPVPVHYQNAHGNGHDKGNEPDKDGPNIGESQPEIPDGPSLAGKGGPPEEVSVGEIDLNPAHQGTSWDDEGFYEDDDGGVYAPVVWHFVLTIGEPEATLSVQFSDPTFDVVDMGWK